MVTLMRTDAATDGDDRPGGGVRNCVRALIGWRSECREMIGPLHHSVSACPRSDVTWVSCVSLCLLTVLFLHHRVRAVQTRRAAASVRSRVTVVDRRAAGNKTQILTHLQFNLQ